MKDLFSPICCWSCVHVILDIGKRGDKRQYRCTKTGKAINRNPHLPTECKHWNK